MNISAISRKLLGIRARPSSPPPAIELLEARIAPASLVSPTTVTFQDKNGDAVTVTISKHLFTTASVAKVFTFDSAFATGSTGGVNSVPQQLEMLNITKLGHARGLDITITAVPVSGSADLSVGYINASGIPLAMSPSAATWAASPRATWPCPARPSIHSRSIRSARSPLPPPSFLAAISLP
jgi:hypothetical protein